MGHQIMASRAVRRACRPALGIGWAGIIVTTGPGEEALASNDGEQSFRELHLASPTLKGFFELAKRARLYVGVDTGPTQIAVAAGTPIVGLFGPTEWWRNGSPNPDDICVERDDIDCRVDCHRRTCSKWICMESSVETVHAAASKELSKTTVHAWSAESLAFR